MRSPGRRDGARRSWRRAGSPPCRPRSSGRRPGPRVAAACRNIPGFCAVCCRAGRPGSPARRHASSAAPPPLRHVVIVAVRVVMGMRVAVAGVVHRQDLHTGERRIIAPPPRLRTGLGRIPCRRSPPPAGRGPSGSGRRGHRGRWCAARRRSRRRRSARSGSRRGRTSAAATASGRPISFDQTFA